MAMEHPERCCCLLWLLLLLCRPADSQTAPPLPTDPAEVAAMTSMRDAFTNSREQLPSWFEHGDPCASWAGVICLASDYPEGAANSTFAHVTELRLLQLNLTGRLAPEASGLRALKYLDVMWNRLTGGIPESFGELANLHLLLVNGNRLSGPLPSALGRLSRLIRIQIDENNFTGPVPESFRNLTAMEHMHMNNNSLSGAVPAGLSAIPNLVHLLLDNNRLTGAPPPGLGSARNLQILQLDNNPFDEGSTVPREYSRMPSLVKLSMRNCNLVGRVPDFVGSPQLGVLDLSENRLEGGVPSFPPRMTAIDLSDNLLSGPVPEGLGSLANLSVLLLGNNDLSGAVPESLGTAPIYRDPSLTIIWDFQNNNISSWAGNASLTILQDTGKSFWFAGNPLCEGQFAVNCQRQTVAKLLQVGGTINASSNLATTCEPCGPPLLLVPNAAEHGCRCAGPLLVSYRLKSPAFAVFDHYERAFVWYISAGVGLAVEQVDLFHYTYEENARLAMEIHFFPLGVTFFNASETQRITTLFRRWKVPDDPTFGPYEAMHITNSYYLIPPGGGSGGLGAAEIVGIILGAALAITVAASAGAALRRRSKRRARKRKRHASEGLLSRIKNSGLHEWTWAEMEKFTSHFADANVLGVGGFGKVYLGVLPDSSKVAIKRAGLAAGSDEQFETEIELLSRVHHRNLVALRGFCQDDLTGDQFLVYEFMENGTVEDHLPPHTHQLLNLPTRLRVALGAAKGINYLHTEASPAIYHRDIKTSNILLDKKFRAKVSDFGVSKNAPESEVEGEVGGAVNTMVKGTPGYLDPEYCLTHSLTDKSDVYSFGVVLMVILTGRQAITQGKNIIRHVQMACEARMPWSLVDPSVAAQCPAEVAEAWAGLALRCCEQDPTERPSMAQVVQELDLLSRELRTELADRDPDGMRLPSFSDTTSSVPSTFTVSDTTNTSTSDLSFPSQQSTQRLISGDFEYYNELRSHV